MLPGYRYKVADSGNQTGFAETFFLAAAKSLKVAGKVGLSNLSEANYSVFFPTGQLKSDSLLGDTSVGFNYLNDTLTTTVVLIGNSIQTNQTGITLAQPIIKNIVLNAGYQHKDYSDNNSANDIQGAIQYMLFNDLPEVALSYKYRYLNFDHPGFHGYFDPQQYSSNTLSLSASYEQKKFVTIQRK